MPNGLKRVGIRCNITLWFRILAIGCFWDSSKTCVEVTTSTVVIRSGFRLKQKLCGLHCISGLSWDSLYSIHLYPVLICSQEKPSRCQKQGLLLSIAKCTSWSFFRWWGNVSNGHTPCQIELGGGQARWNQSSAYLRARSHPTDIKAS